MVQLSFRDSKPIFEQFADSIRKLILANAYAAGDTLPSVQEMAARMTINPNTIRKGYELLEKEGIIYRNSQKEFLVSDTKVNEGGTLRD